MPAARSAATIWRIKLLVEGAWAARAGLLMGRPDSIVKAPLSLLLETYGTDAAQDFGVCFAELEQTREVSMKRDAEGVNLEEAFFAKENAKLLDQMRARAERAQQRELLRRIVAIDDDAFLDRLINMGIGPERAMVLRLTPLVFVAWADGHVDEREREAIVRAAAEQGIVAEEMARQVLGDWLERRDSLNDELDGKPRRGNGADLRTVAVLDFLPREFGRRTEHRPARHQRNPGGSGFSRPVRWRQRPARDAGWLLLRVRRRRELISNAVLT
jgi:hypothetical protein